MKTFDEQTKRQIEIMDKNIEFHKDEIQILEEEKTNVIKQFLRKDAEENINGGLNE